MNTIYDRFDICETTGFLLENPCRRLPPRYDKWQELIDNLPLLIANGQIRNEIQSLPPLCVDDIVEPLKLRYAQLVLTSLMAAYEWGDGDDNAPLILPRGVSLPLQSVCRALGDVPPIVCHATMCLANCVRVDQSKPFTAENTKLLVNMLPEFDNVWFFAITAEIEVIFAGALPFIIDTVLRMQSSEGEVENRVVHNLEAIAPIIGEMQKTLMKMNDGLDADVFYNKLRPFLMGYRGKERFEQVGGLLFQGTSPPLRILHTGGSAAQSSVIQSLDAFLGVTHGGSAGKFLNDQRAFMPRKHVHFLEWLNQHSIEKFVKKNDCTLAAYDKCIETLTKFRNAHLSIVSKYILMPKARLHAKQREDASAVDEGETGEEDARGTGGTELMSFLKEVRNDTQNAAK